MVKSSIVIHKPIETVFAYVSDVKQVILDRDREAKRPTEISFFGIHVRPETVQIEDIQQTSPGPLGVGTSFVQKNTLHGRHSEIIFQIVGYNPPRSITYKFRGSMLPAGEYKFLLAPVVNGTRVKEEIRAEKAFHKFLFLLFGSMMKKHMKAHHHRMKEKLEQLP